MLNASLTYLTVADLAARWRLSPYTVREHARCARIRGAVKVGASWRFLPTAELLPCGHPQGVGAPAPRTPREELEHRRRAAQPRAG